MTRCVVRFKDGNHANLEADMLTQENGGSVFIAYKRNDMEKTAETGMPYEFVGKFSADDISSIYLSQGKPKDEGKRA